MDLSDETTPDVIEEEILYAMNVWGSVVYRKGDPIPPTRGELRKYFMESLELLPAPGGVVRT